MAAEWELENGRPQHNQPSRKAHLISRPRFPDAPHRQAIQKGEAKEVNTRLSRFDLLTHTGCPLSRKGEKEVKEVNINGGTYIGILQQLGKTGSALVTTASIFILRLLWHELMLVHPAG
jgi:hypothetical protein